MGRFTIGPFYPDLEKEKISFCGPYVEEVWISPDEPFPVPGEHDLFTRMDRHFILNPGTSYYDPWTGTYITAGDWKKQKKGAVPCESQHKKEVPERYWDPCLQCERFCNCDWKVNNCPDLLVTTREGEDILLDGLVLRGSASLQRVLREKRSKFRNEWLIELMGEYGWNNRQAGAYMDLKEEKFGGWIWRKEDLEVTKEKEEGISSSCDFEDLIEFPKRPVLDIRDVGTVAYRLSTPQWRWIEKFMELHMDQVEENVNTKRRELEYFGQPICMKEPINYYNTYEWEEELLEDMPSVEFWELIQVAADSGLGFIDLQEVLIKWMYIYNGVPSNMTLSEVELHDDDDNQDDEKVENGIIIGVTETEKKFFTSSPQPIRLTSFHMLQIKRIRRQRKYSLVWRLRIWQKYRKVPCHALWR